MPNRSFSAGFSSGTRRLARAPPLETSGRRSQTAPLQTRKTGDLAVLCALRGKFTLKQEEFRDLKAPQGQLAARLAVGLEHRLRSGRPEARQGQVRSESAPLGREAPLFHG